MLEYRDPAHSIIAWSEDGGLRTVIVERGDPRFAELAARDPKPYEPPPPPDPEAELAAERAAMVCSRLQGRLVLGPQTCAAIDALAADPDTPWAMRETILNAIEWRRTSQAMTELGYLLGYTGEQMDALFRQAMTVEV